MKEIHMLAGPNGAGKTTTALALIEEDQVEEFINADEIAKALAPLNPESMALTASKLMIKRMKDLLLQEKSFSFETTAAGANYVKHIKSAKSKGYGIKLTFLWLSTPDQAVRRVAQRVKQGGHNIPEAAIRRRYVSGIKNLIGLYLPLADEAVIVDASEGSGDKIAVKSNLKPFQIIHAAYWQQIEKVAYDN